jgi:hypothetical protein
VAGSIRPIEKYLTRNQTHDLVACLAKDRVQWWASVNMAMILRDPWGRLVPPEGLGFVMFVRIT